MMTELKIATRRSRLALAQAEHVAQLLRRAHPDAEVSMLEVSTTGDMDRTTSVTTLTEVGAFVRSVQQAVLDGRADLAVHSCKDLPVAGPAELISFYPAREQPWDVLCGHDLVSLPDGARVGTGSPRRAAQMLRLRPDVEIADIRGNVDTRLDKVRHGGFDAVILAEAGLARLGLGDEIGHRFSLEEMVPAPAQAALAVEVRSGTQAVELVEVIDDARVRAAVEAERMLLALTQAGCRSALGALGQVDPTGMVMSGFVEDDRGPRFATVGGESPDDAARVLQKALSL